MSRRWTPEEDRMLEAERHRGATREQAAERLGRTYDAIRHRAQKLGIKGWRRAYGAARISARDQALMIRLHGEGLSGVEIAGRLGCRPQTVYNRIAALRKKGVLPPAVKRGRPRRPKRRPKPGGATAPLVNRWGVFTQARWPLAGASP